MNATVRHNGIAYHEIEHRHFTSGASFIAILVFLIIKICELIEETRPICCSKKQKQNRL